MIERYHIVFAGLVALAGCNHAASDDLADAWSQPRDSARAPADAPPFVEGSHPVPPSVISFGGQVMTSPMVRPIFFTGDDSVQHQIELFLAVLASSSYWATTTGEYGVGPIAVAPTIVTSDPPPASWNDMSTLFSTHLGADWGPPDPQAIYAVYLPADATIATPQGVSCQDFAGLHDVELANGTRIVFALLPRCRQDLDSLTEVTTHELVEAATDPYIDAYAGVDADHWVWGRVHGPELGDMCVAYAGGGAAPLAGFSIQRTWSNASALAGHDPCVPQLGTYATAMPVVPDRIAVTPDGSLTTRGVQIAVGTSKQIEVDLYSDAYARTWQVAAYGNSAELTFSWTSGNTGSNGSKLTLEITHLVDRPSMFELITASPDPDVSDGRSWAYVGM